MARRKAYSDEKKVAVMAALAAGQSIGAVAAEHDVPVSTVRGWKARGAAHDAPQSIAAAYNIVHPKKRAFLEAYTVVGTVTAAANAASIGRITHYDWLNADEAYRAAFEHAKDQAADYLESVAYQRAVEGVEVNFYDREGNLARTDHRYSDTLLIFMLKGARPEKYKERVQQEHSGPGGEPLQITTIVVEKPDGVA